MPSVSFLPAGVTVDVPEGTLVPEAALRAGIDNLELPCGGQGSCGQCLVELLDAGGQATEVMACQTAVKADLVVRLPATHDLAMQVVGGSRFLNRNLLPERAKLAPLFRWLPLCVPPASIDEHYSDWSRLRKQLARAGYNGPVQAELSVLRALAGTLRIDDGRVTAGIAEHGGTWRLVELRPGHVDLPAYGLAVDIGTTTVAAQLADLADGRVLAAATSYNQQLRRGADIISRIDYARTDERRAELRQLALDTIHALIAEMTAESGVDRRQIRAAFLAGNTTMIHLLLGLPPRYIRETPYVPTVNPVPAFFASDLGLDIRPDASVQCAPGVGSYVGGDITAGLLCTELMTNRESVFLFLDIGTNGEIVVGNADWIVGCACSAGPAFEGSGIQCGMRASPGAIERVELGDGGRTVACRVIGGGRPAGICGSGLICLLGQLFRTGVIDAAGHIHVDTGNPRVVSAGSRRAFIIEFAAGTASGEDLVIAEAELENLIRTKAAIYAACSRVLENVGLDWSAIARVYIAGGFGRYIRLSEAILIGMLPDLPRARFTYLGNSALTGAYIALLSRAHRQTLDGTASRMTYIDLSSDSRYMDSYVKAMFLPHTDLSQFPSVQSLLSCVE